MQKVHMTLFIIAVVVALTIPVTLPVAAETGLVGLWHFDENAAGTPGDSTAYDSSGYGNDASLHCGATTQGTGVLNTALTLNVYNGSPDFMGSVAAIPYSASLNITGPYTFDAYLKIMDCPDHSNAYRPIFLNGPDSMGAEDQEHGIEIYVKGTEALFVGHNRRSTTGGTFGEVSFPCPPLGQFFHLVVTFDGTKVRAYYDGVEQTAISGSGTIPAPTSSSLGWWIGRLLDSQFPTGTTSKQSGFCGLMDELKIYNKALNPPVVAITAPGNDVYTAGTVPALAYTVDDPDATVDVGVIDQSVGIHTITVTATNAAGLEGSASVTYVVYDPSGGFVTGGGWITSPMGAYAGDPKPLGLWHFDENAAGTPGDSTAYDSSGYGNDASLHCGATTQGTGVLNTALTLNVYNGSPDFMGSVAAIPYSASLNITGPYTFDAYLKIMDCPDHSNAYRPIFLNGPDSMGAEDQEHGIEIYVKGTEALFVGHNRRSTTGGTFGEVSFPCPPLGQFFHLVVTFDGTKVRAYYDGVEQTAISGSGTIPAPTSSSLGWWIGRLLDSQFPTGTTSKQSGFCGLMDELKIWDTVTYDTGLDRKATFGFVGNYNSKTKMPQGNTEFRFKAGDLNFKSNSYQWLILNQAGTNAQLKGHGTINGTGNFGFMLWAKDGTPDTFRIKIWEGDNETAVVYDNGVDQPIGGGSIIVHKGK